MEAITTNPQMSMAEPSKQSEVPMKLKVILKQIWCLITNDKYPTVYINLNKWVWKWDKNGNVKYNHFKTLTNYIFN